jgi:hypothetical protein
MFEFVLVFVFMFVVMLLYFQLFTPLYMFLIKTEAAESR